MTPVLRYFKNSYHKKNKHRYSVWTGIPPSTKCVYRLHNAFTLSLNIRAFSCLLILEYVSGCWTGLHFMSVSSISALYKLSHPPQRMLSHNCIYLYIYSMLVCVFISKDALFSTGLCWCIMIVLLFVLLLLCLKRITAYIYDDMRSNALFWVSCPFKTDLGIVNQIVCSLLLKWSRDLHGK